ncbi:L-idonate 5-dehydrogenase [Meridianimarinicoccus aquatilis]|uniref:L-idonate 5-dehydrogenase n=1 Tax=Meridianimarinicoccus aquatilis TaxID=2552766 RepID=A0A4R6B2V8_9RHOB|nr:L-idonate 5-dehydrogenase [Fluviibacterium aquatile]TDL90504.1 L-idonate 5-dehydrogenase [Fluviibacterium aquatile]
MKVVVAHAAKDLRIETREVPELGAGQVLVKMAAGGICGSDLHYYNHGGFGTVRLKEPMILGHEVSGHVEAVGDGVAKPQIGTLVAVSPSRPCGACEYCAEGLQNHCMNMRFYGSAMPFPHIQGAFREYVVADAAQCADAGNLTSGEAAMAEPLSVVLHAAKQAGDLMGKRVLVTGCGPIGLLAVLVARAAGAVHIVATDITEFTLSTARAIGADEALNTAEHPQALEPYSAGKGFFDVLFECTGVAQALAGAIPALRPGATIAQLGLGGDMTLPVQAMTAKELQFKGSFRFHSEFFTAVEMMRSGRIDVTPLITHRFTVDEAEAAFAMAGDRTQAIKVNLTF